MTTVLIVDDDEIARDALEHMLVRAGYEVMTANHGLEALHILETQSCRFVVCDWMMPTMDGLELCRRIRGQEFPGYVYVILLTSRDRTEDVIDGLSAGADDFITKPFEPAELLARMKIGERILSIETRDVAIFAMAKLAESRDPETGEHLERIRTYSQILAHDLAADPDFKEPMSPDFPRMIYLTSPLHDIGKVGIPDCVLLKPGRLSDREFDIMKTHTTIGASTLEAALKTYPGVSYLQVARNIALTHHERWDGSGYPRGLRGKNIPLCGRIVAVADVYDALTSKRVYKPAYTHDVAKSMILDEEGKHFDPQLIRAFRRCEEKFLATLESHTTHEPMLVG